MKILILKYAYCKRCKFELKIPNFTEEEKLTIWGLSSIVRIKKIMDLSKLDKREAKGLMVHINKKYGHCHRCNKTDLVGENVECPKCKTFNLNWKIE